ncbi:MAG: HAMP domain-containing histidine kinase [Deltaproteobacteria bacterium]|nr:HAMP domain-containing histidine kinase [Deltaproteobacteria bacterium]
MSTERNTPADANPHQKGLPTAALAALAAALIPLVCGALVIGVTGLRLEETDRRLDTGLARVASSWLADRLALVAEGARLDLLARAGDELGALTGLFDTDGHAIGPTPLTELSADDLRSALAGDLDEVSIEGGEYGIAATALRPPLGRLSVIVAMPDQLSGRPALPSLARLLLLAFLLVIAAGLFGFGLGGDFGAAVDRLRLWIRGAARDPLAERSDAKPRSEGANELTRAIGRFEERLAEEWRAYRDAQNGLAALDGERTDLLTSVSRELHSPLEQVVGVAGELLEGKYGELQTSQRDDVRIIRNGGLRLLKMVEEVIDLSSLVGGDLELDPDPVDLVEVAREVTEAARGQLGKKKIDVALEQGEPQAPVLVRGNRQRLWQVTTNLVSNAIKFTESGAVTVRVGRDGEGSALLEVEDTGVGVSAMDQRSIFESFRQLGGRGGRKRGTGLGLAICRRLIEMHGGTIRISSMLTQGSKFTVQLPEAK